MITTRVSVQFPDDWTETIGRMGVEGDIYTATLHKHHYIGLIRLQGRRLEDALDLVRRAPYHTDVEVVEHRGGGAENATVLVSAELTEKTPFVVMLENGYMPLDPTVLRNGREHFDLIVRSRDRLLELVDRLDEVGDVNVERAISDVETPAGPNPVAWRALQEALTDRQRQALSAAVELGYFSVPREATLDDLAAELDVGKSTAGEHLRRAVDRVSTFVVEEQSGDSELAVP